MAVYPVLQSYFKSLFKDDAETFEVNFWWYGVPVGFQKKSPSNLRRDAHRQRISREIAPWDVMVRLAIKYAWIQIKEKGLRFENGYSHEMCKRFITYLLWSRVTLVRPVKMKDGREFNVQSFWSWAAEHKGMFRPHGSSRAPRSLGDLLAEAHREKDEKVQG